MTKMNCEFELGRLIESMIGLSVDQKLRILTSLGIDLNGEAYKSHFRGWQPPAPENSAPQLRNAVPAALEHLFFELRPENVTVRIEFRPTLLPPMDRETITQGKA